SSKLFFRQRNTLPELLLSISVRRFRSSVFFDFFDQISQSGQMLSLGLLNELLVRRFVFRTQIRSGVSELLTDRSLGLVLKLNSSRRTNSTELTRPIERTNTSLKLTLCSSSSSKLRIR